MPQVCVGRMDRQRDGQRDGRKDKQVDRPTDVKMDIQTTAGWGTDGQLKEEMDRWKKGQINRLTHWLMDRWLEQTSQKNKRMDRQTYGKMDIQAGRGTEKQLERQADRWKSKQIDGQTGGTG